MTTPTTQNTSQNTSQDTSKPEIKIALCTPYLYKSAETFETDQQELEKQMQKYGYNPANFHNTKFLETNKYLLHLANGNDHQTERPEDCHLMIAGCTEDTEQNVFRLKSSGALIARYSIFYGKPSGYTNIKPEDAGYSFDIPKDIDTVKAFLTNDQLLESILEREEQKIRNAVNSLNKNIAAPILITPYLTEALKITPIWQTGIRPPQDHPMDQLFDYVGLRLEIENQQ